MNELMFHLRAMLAPLIISNVLHMLVVKLDLAHALSIPLHKSYFGQNKTLRGLLFIPICNGLASALVLSGAQPAGTAFKIGFILGLAYVLAELPNSYFKRRKGITAGAAAGTVFILLDKTDSALGVSLVYSMYFGLPFLMGLQLFCCAALTHAFLSLLLYLVKIKSAF